jgi:hypothetical protein
MTKKTRVEIWQDSDFADSPREWDNLGTIATWHRHYRLGDLQPTVDQETYIAGLKDEDYTVMAVYMYDHGRIALSTRPFSCAWDSGLLGVIYASERDILENFQVTEITDEIRAKVKRIFECEVDIYSAYLNGEVHGFSIYEGDELQESIGGFYGNKEEFKSAILDYVNIADEALIDEALEKYFYY